MSKTRCIGVSESGWPIIDLNSIDTMEEESVDFMDNPAWEKFLKTPTRHTILSLQRKEGPRRPRTSL